MRQVWVVGVRLTIGLDNDDVKSYKIKIAEGNLSQDNVC